MGVRHVDSIDGGAAVRVDWEDGTRARFHAIWLLDNAQDPDTRNPGNGQKLISVLDLPPDPRIASVEVVAEGIAVRFEPGGKCAKYGEAWLRARRYDSETAGASGRIPAGAEPWNRRTAGALPAETFSNVSCDRAALARWLAAVRRLGVAVLTGVPNEDGALCRVVDLFGFVRETNYGRWFNVRAEVNPENLAYTNLGLQAHTDNPYRDPVPTLQLLACLENTVEGGESIVVDGFAAALRLKNESPQSFALLAGYPARFAYAGTTGVRLAAKRPMIELGPDGELQAIRFNNRSTAAIVDVPYDSMPAYYVAWRRFAEIIEDPEMAVTFRLSPGELFIVDNTRVLHARNAFSGSGRRWLQGCYADKDGLLSTLSSIEEQGRTP